MPHSINQHRADIGKHYYREQQRSLKAQRLPGNNPETKALVEQVSSVSRDHEIFIIAPEQNPPGAKNGVCRVKGSAGKVVFSLMTGVAIGSLATMIIHDNRAGCENSRDALKIKEENIDGGKVDYFDDGRAEYTPHRLPPVLSALQGKH